MKRLVRWLREPITPPPKHDEVDWERLGRSMGSMMGGNLNAPPSNPNARAVRAWERGKNVPTRPPKARGWYVLSFAVMAVEIALLMYLFSRLSLH